MFATFAIAAQHVVELVVPRRCIVCNEFGAEICAQCWERFSQGPVFRRCALPPIDNVVALGPHTGALRTAVLAIKFRQRCLAAFTLGALLAERAAMDGDFLIPVPLHHGRLRERGFNQASEIAKGISSQCKIPVAEHVIVRARNTTTQTNLTLRLRRANVASAFAIGPLAARVRGCRVVLVDDVMTTGATLHACAQQLEGLDVSRINAAVIACRL